MTTAPDHIDDTPSPTDLRQFVHQASNLFELLQTAKHERDRGAAKALLATASSILQSEIGCRSRTEGVRPGALGSQIARVRPNRRESAPHYPRQGPQHRSAVGSRPFKNYWRNCGIVAIGLIVDVRAMGQPHRR
jgi:hypothetical protein